MTKKKEAKTAVAEAPKAGVIPAEFEERIDIERPDIYPQAMIERHRNRYFWACGRISDRFARSGWTLDAACGTGYGSSLLLSNSHKVVGLDGDASAIKHARERFGGSLLAFRQADFARPLPVNGDQFDAAVTIETIEHLTEAAASYFLGELHRSLTKNGLLVLSTPIFNAARGLTSTFHIKEYTPNEMVALITSAGFVDVKVDDIDERGFSNLGDFMFITARKPGKGESA